MKLRHVKALLAVLVVFHILSAFSGCGGAKPVGRLTVKEETNTVSKDESTVVKNNANNGTEETAQISQDEKTVISDEENEVTETATVISTRENNNKSANSANASKTLSSTGKVDLKGYTFKVAAWWNLDPKSPGNVYYEKAVQREKEVKAKYNIKIRYIDVPGQGLRDKISSSVMAGDPVGDICRCRSGWVLPSLAGKGYLEPADKYFDVSDPLWNPYVTKQSMYKGHPMGVNHGPLASYACMLYNRSMLQRLGLVDPQTLVAFKKWTWAKFEEYIKKIAKDTDNDGKLNIYGTSNVIFQSAVASNGGRIVSDINGKDVFTLGRPEAVEALKWVQTINNLGVAGGSMADFANGKVGFYWWWNYDWGFKNTIKDKWGILPSPMGPKAKDYAAWWDEVHLMTIPANSKHPKETAAIWTDLSRWYPGVEGRERMYQDILENQYLDKKDIDMAQFISTKFWLDKYFAYNQILDDMFPWPDNGNGIDSIMEGKGTKTIEQWLAEKTGKYQSIIDQMWATFK